MTDADMAALTRKLADTAIEQSELYQAAKRDAEEAEAYAAELEAKLAWKPIETAPKDGTRILIYDPEDWSEDEPPTIYVCFWKGYWCEAEGEQYTLFKPTHWMELPEEPKETDE